MPFSAVAIVTASAGIPMAAPGLADRGHAGADRQLARDEVGATRRTACLGVVVGEQHAFGGELVEIRRPPGHHAAVIGADIPDADVVAHDNDDVRPLAGRCRRRCRLLCLCRGCQPDGRERRSGDERSAAQQQIASLHSTARLRRDVAEISRWMLITHGILLSVLMQLAQFEATNQPLPGNRL
jgi:hypothetical protein